MSFARWRRGFLLFLGLWGIVPAHAQTITNQSLSGKYFFRQVSVDGGGNPANAASLIGTITFDGAANYSFAAQQVLGTGAATAQMGTARKYTVDPAGFVTMDNPIRAGETLNARYGPVALLGSSTESTGPNYDLFVAIPAPTVPTAASSLSGSFWAATLEFPGGTFANARNTLFELVTSGPGTFMGFAVSGHAANVSSGQLTGLQVNGATYTMNNDGIGSANFGAASGTALLSGTRTIYLSKDGNLLLGGSTANGSHDILIGVKAISGASQSSWSGNFWAAGLRQDSSAVTGFAGAIAPRGTGQFIWTRRLKTSGVGNLDFTGVNSYTLNGNGSGSAQVLTQVALGDNGNAFIGSSIHPSDPAAYEIYFGALMPSVSGTGVWIDPQGIVNAASFAPVGNPIAPGGFLSVYGFGLANSSQTALPPYPTSGLNGVSVLINSQLAAVYQVAVGAFSKVDNSRMDLLVPYGITGRTATIQVQNNGVKSNTVTVLLAPTAPGVLTVNENGSGIAAMQHADYTPVTTGNPAVGGETIIIYMTALGAVNPPVQDGFPGGANPPSSTTMTPNVLIGGKPGTVAFSGLSNFPGLYQINVQLPAIPPGISTLPVAIQTRNAYHDQVDIPVQP